ncbi:hypothetical protein NMY22_g13585 [Coprinellus aureogranulatus]|nr:hypothetical protein NMY22_g13585 [Coprinellus aureogranulatus]
MRELPIAVFPLLIVVADKCMLQGLNIVIASVLVLFPLSASAAEKVSNFERCLERVRSGEFGTGRIGATNSRGDILNDSPQDAEGLSYELCIKCGEGPEAFDWAVFAQQFSSWFLPWIALVSQLPFGPKDRLDNLESVYLTFGSPTLAAFSLALTVLNRRWIARRFSDLQQAPLRVSSEDDLPMEHSEDAALLSRSEGDALLASLVILPRNDRWWKELVERLDSPHTWSFAAGTSIAWVLTAYILTLVLWFTGQFTESSSAGQAVGALFLWLLIIVVGWLALSPKCDEERLHYAVNRANEVAYVASDSNDTVIPAQHLPHTQRAITLNFLRDHSDPGGALRVDERNTAPIYNYARLLPWVNSVETVFACFQAASVRYQRHESVNSDVKWVQLESLDEPPNAINRMGNTSQVVKYCSFEGLQLEARGSRCGPNVFSRIAAASSMALLLQWGTTGAAIIVVYHTPAVGLGCKSLSYLLFGVLSTLVWMLLLASSILAHCATALRRVGGRSAAAARWFSIALRRIGKLLAAFNSIAVVVTCLFSFGNFYNRCYCNTSVLGRGISSAYYSPVEITLPDVAKATLSAWIGGSFLAIGAAVIFGVFLILNIKTAHLPKEMVSSNLTTIIPLFPIPQRHSSAPLFPTPQRQPS